MQFTFGPYQLAIDTEKTRQFYQHALPVSKGCSCDGCLNFEQAVPLLPPSVRSFFSGLGIEMQNVCECYVNRKTPGGALLYGGFYHLCGTLLAGESAWTHTSAHTSHWDNDAAFSITPDFHVSFQTELALLEPDFPLPAVQLEFSASIPWVLHHCNPY